MTYSFLITLKAMKCLGPYYWWQHTFLDYCTKLRMWTDNRTNSSEFSQVPKCVSKYWLFSRSKLLFFFAIWLKALFAIYNKVSFFWRWSVMFSVVFAITWRFERENSDFQGLPLTGVISLFIFVLLVFVYCALHKSSHCYCKKKKQLFFFSCHCNEMIVTDPHLGYNFFYDNCHFDETKKWIFRYLNLGGIHLVINVREMI